MAFRSLTIASEADVRVRAGQLVVDRDEPVTIPVEDIATLTLENPRVRVSAAALAILSSAGVPVILCDRRHMPVGVLNGFCSHSRQLAVVKAQTEMSRPLQKRLWQMIVRGKVRNQATCLEALGIPGAERLREYVDTVTSGDGTGVEASAARLYFRHLMPGERRHAGCQLDCALDYGYAVLRAHISRLLVGHGFYPPLGIHHANESNAFNLADDLLEPFRPFADLLACSSDADMGAKEGRMVMARVLYSSCRIDDSAHSVLTAGERVVISLHAAIVEADRRKLLLPELLPVSPPLTVAIQDR